MKLERKQTLKHLRAPSRALRYLGIINILIAAVITLRVCRQCKPFRWYTFGNEKEEFVFEGFLDC